MLRKIKAFTLLELIVVIVILGILAALAIPTFGAVLKRSQDETTLSGLKSLAREAQAIKALDQSPEWDPEIVNAAVGDLNAYSRGVNAAGKASAVDKVPTTTSEIGYLFQAETSGGPATILYLTRLSASGNYCTVAALESSIASENCEPLKGNAKPGDVLSDETLELPPVSNIPAPTPTTPAPTPTETTPSYKDDGVIRSVKIADLKYNSAAAVWDEIDQAEEYILVYGPQGGAMQTITTKTLSAGFANLQSDTTYNLRIQAVRADNPSNSEIFTFTTLTAPVVKTLPIINTNALQSSAAILDNKIYALLGGTSLFQYNETTKVWDRKTAAALYGSATAPVNLIAAGGRLYKVEPQTALISYYDPAANVWTSASAPNDRVGAAVTATSDGKILVIGGGTSSGTRKTYSTFNPQSTSSDKWTTSVATFGADLTTPEAMTIGSDVYIFNWAASKDAKDIYSLNGTLLGSSGSKSTTQPVAISHNGKGYLLSTNTSGKNYIEEFDPATKTLKTIATIEETAMTNPAMVVYDNKLYVMNGARNGVASTAQVEIPLP